MRPGRPAEALVIRLRLTERPAYSVCSTRWQEFWTKDKDGVSPALSVSLFSFNAFFSNFAYTLFEVSHLHVRVHTRTDVLCEMAVEVGEAG